MSNKRKAFILLYIFISLFFISKIVYGIVDCEVVRLESEKDFYYYYETLDVNASWNLFYDESKENAYVQIHILDQDNKIVWNSTTFDEIGLFERHWEIEIQSLNFSFITNPSNLFIKFFIFSQTNGFGPNFDYLETVMITVAKNDIICELEGYKNYIRYGNILNFTGFFYFASNDSALRDYDIEVEVRSNNGILSLNNYTTNQHGVIFLNFSSNSELDLGENEIIFRIIDNKFLNNSIFHYDVIVGKTQVFYEVLKFENKISIDNVAKIALFLYYSNYTNLPLKDVEIDVSIYSDNNLKYGSQFKTNQSGFLEIIIKSEDIEIRENTANLVLYINFLGNDFIENKSISFNLEYIETKNNSLLQTILISNGLIFSFIGSLVYIKNRSKKVKSKVVKDIYFKF